MQNTHLISYWYHGIIVPEFWRLETDSLGSLEFIFSKSCIDIFEHCRIDATDNEFENPLPSSESRWGYKKCMPPLSNSGDEFRLSIPTTLQVTDSKRRLICLSISDMLDILNFNVQSKLEEKRGVKEKEKVQLFSIDTVCVDQSKEYSGFSNWGLNVSISPQAADFLETNSLKSIPGAFEAMKAHHVAKFPKDKKTSMQGFFGTLSAGIREKGTLSYQTCGNCACLGYMPVDRQVGEGLYIESHNIDNSWQQLNLLIGVAATWQWVRRSLA